MTKEQWKQLSDKAQWDIKVALRGPDCFNSETIKWFSTSVIRGQVREAMRVGGAVNDDLKLIILPANPHFDGFTNHPYPLTLKWNSAHFFQHVSEAAGWLGIPVYHIEEKIWLTGVGKSANSAGKIFLEEFLKLGKSGSISDLAVKELARHVAHIHGASQFLGDQG